MDHAGEITQLLNRLNGDGSSEDEWVIDQLMPLVYGELKILARASRYRLQGHGGPRTTSFVACECGLRRHRHRS